MGRPISENKKSPAIWLGAALFALTLTAYAPIFRAGFIWDDDAYVENNPTLRSISGLIAIWTDPSATPQYYPLVHTSFWLEYHLWGADSAMGYHLLNVLLHGLSATLLWRLLILLEVPGAWLAAAIFAVHPLNVESVAWITERKNVLSGVFYFLSLRSYLRWEMNPSRPRGGYTLSLLFFVLALFSKTVTATLPAAVLLLLWWKRGRLTWKDIRPLLPFFIIAAVMGSFTGYLERTNVGAHGPPWSQLTVLDRLLIASRAVWFYAGKLVWPHPLSFIYRQWRIDPRDWREWIYPAALAGLICGLWLARRRLGRGPLVAVLLFIGTLFPALGFVNVYPMRYSFVADHFQYLAGISLIVLIVAFCTEKYRLSAGAIVVPVLGILTFLRCGVYHDRETLWRDTIAKNPASWMAHTNLGHVLHAQGRDSEAWAQYQQAAALAPNVADTHLNLAIGQAVYGNLGAAMDECRAAIALNHEYVDAYGNLAKALLQENRVAEAATIAQQAIRINPRYPMAYLELGRAQLRTGDIADAVNSLATAAALNPGDAESHFELADCLMHMLAFDEAIAHYQAGLGLDDKNAAAWTNLGMALLQKNQTADAANCFRRALAIDPQLQPAVMGLRRAGGL